MFQCALHSFETNDKEAIREHKANFAHTIMAHGKCQECKTPMKFVHTGTLTTVHPMAWCQSCRDKSENKAVISWSDGDVLPAPTGGESQ